VFYEWLEYIGEPEKMNEWIGEPEKMNE
jgi:hypothetical protein